MKSPYSSASTRLPRRIYIPRITGFGFGAIAIYPVLLQLALPTWIWIPALFTGLIWPHAAFLWATHSSNPRETEKNNLVFDALQIGFFVAVMGFNVVPSTMYATFILMNNISVGGWRLGVVSVGHMLIGILVGGLSTGWQFAPASSLWVQVACMPMLIMYPLMFGWVAHRLAHQLNSSRNEQRRLSEYDGLSGVHNRRFFEIWISKSFHKFLRDRHVVTLLLCDIDLFKQINDVYGHTAGDAVIRRVGHVLASKIRQGDIAARYGGDEFVVLLDGISPDGALAFVERVQRALRPDSAYAEPTPAFTLSFGIAALDSSMATPERWVEAADRALYSVKKKCRGKAEVAKSASSASSPPLLLPAS